MEPVLLKPIYHQNNECIGIFFKQNGSIEKIIRKQPGVKWSQTHRCWYVPLTESAYKLLYNCLKENSVTGNSLLKQYLEKKKKVHSSLPEKIKTTETNALQPITKSQAWQLSTENLSALEKFVQMLKLKAYSESTIRTYRNEFLQLLKLLKRKPVHELTAEDLKRYMVYSMEKEGIKENTAHSRLNALKFYFEQVLGKEKFFWEIPRPKKQLQLPRFFNQDEIVAIIKSAGNVKNKTMLMLAYASGLRVSEVVNIKTRDIDSKRMCILIRQAKGKKDRMVSLSPVLLMMLREYYKTGEPSKEGFLFPGQNKDTAYSSRSLQLVMAAAKKKAMIYKPGSIHALRHSFATHLLDKGTDVTMIMKLLGHNDLKTTLRYLHVSNRDMLRIISPLDDLDL